MNIVVVELPAKAKTINKYLGPGYEVLASFGHIRDLPPKDGSVDPDADFRMLWEVDARSNQRINDIARALKGADKLILATDPDREGEAISWHVLEVLKEKKALKDHEIERVVFNAITKQAVTRGDEAPAQDRRRAGRRLSRPPRARLPGRLHALPRALAQAAGRPLGRPRAVGGAAAGLRPRAGDREIRRRANTGRSRRRWRPRATRPSRRASPAPTARRSSASTSAPAPRRKPSPAIWKTRPSTSPMSRPSPRGAIRRRPSPPRPCSRRPRASSASRRRTPCGWPSASMRASTSAARPSASSPICAPTASTWRRRRSPPSAA